MARDDEFHGEISKYEYNKTDFNHNNIGSVGYDQTIT
jgi:hypothetical protein